MFHVFLDLTSNLEFLMNFYQFSWQLPINLALHQHFLGKDPQIWFRAVCQTLSSTNFIRDYFIVLFVVCVNPEIIAGSTKSFGKQWFGIDRIQDKEAFSNAVKAAIRDPETMKYPKTFQLF